MSAPLPDRPDERRFIVALTEAQYGRCGYDAQGTELLRRRDTWVVQVPVPDDVRADKRVTDLLNSGHLEAGEILLQSPYNGDRYTPADTYLESVAVQKHLIFAELCRLLGATRFKVTAASDQRREVTVTGSAAGNKKLFRGELKVEDKRLDSLVSKLHLEDAFTHPEVNAGAARQLLADNNLEDEPYLSSLVTARSAGGAELKRRAFTLDATREAQRRLALAGKVKIPVITGLNAAFERVVRETETYRITYEIDF